MSKKSTVKSVSDKLVVDIDMDSDTAVRIKPFAEVTVILAQGE